MNLAMKYFKDCQRQPRLISRKTLRMAQPSPSTIKHAEEKTRIRKNWTLIQSAVRVFTMALGKHSWISWWWWIDSDCSVLNLLTYSNSLGAAVDNKWECIPTSYLKALLNLHFSIDALVETNVPLRRVVVNIVGVVEKDLLTPSDRVARLGLQIMKLKYE